MSEYSLKHLSAEEVIAGLKSSAARHRESVIKILELVDELERRKLPVPIDPELLAEYRSEIPRDHRSEDEK